MKRHVDIVQGFVEEQFCDKAAVERGIDWRGPFKIVVVHYLLAAPVNTY